MLALIFIDVYLVVLRVLIIWLYWNFQLCSWKLFYLNSQLYSILWSSHVLLSVHSTFRRSINILGNWHTYSWKWLPSIEEGMAYLGRNAAKAADFCILSWYLPYLYAIWIESWSMLFLERLTMSQNLHIGLEGLASYVLNVSYSLFIRVKLRN